MTSILYGGFTHLYTLYTLILRGPKSGVKKAKTLGTRLLGSLEVLHDSQLGHLDVLFTNLIPVTKETYHVTPPTLDAFRIQ